MTAAHVIGILLGLACLPVAIAVLVFATQVVAACLAPRRSTGALQADPSTRPRIAVLTPAHDEAEGMGAMLAALQPQLRAGDRMVVVADNCTDETAAIARAAGAVVVERVDATLRGKSFALAFGVDAMRADPPDVVVVVDADCRLAPGSLDALANGVVIKDRPMQALDLMIAVPGAGVSRRFAEFAWRVRNWVRPAGAHQLGLPCQLMGTGMAFTWSMIAQARLATGALAEDMNLGIDFAMAGKPPLFCETALVTSYFPESAAAIKSQRTRWEHGHLETIFREMPRVLASAVVRADVRLLGMALDLCVPPLALLAALLLGLDAVGAVAWAFGATRVVDVSVALTVVFAAAVMLAWAIRGRDLIRFTELLSVPIYVAAKVPIYVRFLFRRQKQWVRTDRK
jgi:cellulose synthase/poly-beta-1,6-N-acetylglucosamine synthase-like glycosyltransferase